MNKMNIEYTYSLNMAFYNYIIRLKSYKIFCIKENVWISCLKIKIGTKWKII